MLELECEAGLIRSPVVRGPRVVIWDVSARRRPLKANRLDDLTLPADTVSVRVSAPSLPHETLHPILPSKRLASEWQRVQKTRRATPKSGSDLVFHLAARTGFEPVPPP